jgi:hypothetical protein
MVRLNRAAAPFPLVVAAIEPVVVSPASPPNRRGRLDSTSAGPSPRTWGSILLIVPMDGLEMLALAYHLKSRRKTWAG